MDNKNKCTHCDQHFQHRHHMLRHVRTKHGNEKYDCECCNSSITQKTNLVRHLKNCRNKRSLEDGDMEHL